MSQDYQELNEKAKTYIENEDYENALIYLNKIYQIKPDDLENLDILVSVNMVLNRFEDSIEIAHKFPKDCWIRYSIIGNCYNQLNQKEKALKNFLKNYEMNPRKETLMDLAFFYEHENEYEKAFKYVFEVLKMDENDIDALAILIELYFYTHQFEKVIDCSKKALEISDKRDDIIYPPLAFSYLYSGEQQKGWDCLVEAIFKHPNDNSFYYSTFGTYLFAIKDDIRALQTFEIAHKKYPSSPEPFLALSMHYKSEGDLKKAKMYYEKYLNLEKYCIMDFDDF